MDAPPFDRAAVTVPTRTDIEAAVQRLSGRIRRTPVLELTPDDLDVGGRVVLKLELMQHVGVFKARGALNSVLDLQVPADGVLAASGGNHGAAVAWAAEQAGVPARIYIPSTSPQLKVDRIASHGADVVVVDGYYPDAFAASQEWAAEHEVLTIHAYDLPAVIAGQGTLGTEMVEQVPDAAAVLMPCGGGGLYAGIALAVGGAVKTRPVEPEQCPTLHSAVRHGAPTKVEVGGVAADSLGAGVIGDIAYAVASSRGDVPVLVGDEAIRSARRFLWERCRVLAEPGGVVALAAVMSGAYRPAPDETTMVVISGGNHPDLP